MKRTIVISAIAALMLLGAGCSSGNTGSSDGLFSGNSSASSPLEETRSNSGAALPSAAVQPTQIGPQ